MLIPLGFEAVMVMCKWHLCIWINKVRLYQLLLWTDRNFHKRLNLQAQVKCLLLSEKLTELK